MVAILSSAVIPPDPPAHPTSPDSTPNLNKRHSPPESPHSPASKRSRLSPTASDTPNTSVSEQAPPARRSHASAKSALEERKRGQRLFGTLLGTLSRSQAQPRSRGSGRGVPSKGAPPEGAKSEKASARRQELKETQQRLWDERCVSPSKPHILSLAVKLILTSLLQMRRRHINKRAEARFLQTTAEPRLVSYDPSNSCMFADKIIVLQASSPPPLRAGSNRTPNSRDRRNHHQGASNPRKTRKSGSQGR